MTVLDYCSGLVVGQNQHGKEMKQSGDMDGRLRCLV